MSKELMLENIRRAQKEIEAKRDKVKQGRLRQNYHFMAEAGWINDPNGLIYFNGKYHFFYQYNPYDSYWGEMYWGHAVSDDMLHWEYLPIALAPSETYDSHKKGGCFSGSAIEHNGMLYLFYTGTANYGNGFIQTQCMAYSSDGIHFEKYEQNPIISEPPEGFERENFRDPKVWKKNGIFYLVCGGKKNNLASALLYKSADLKNWEFVNVLAESRGELGTMWECPDFYEIGNKHVLMFSPMGLHERTKLYLVGDMDYETGKFTYSTIGEIDWGFDFYAAQSFLDHQGRRIIVSWANAWDWMPWWKDWGPTFKEGWCGSFNIPREVVLCGDNTLQFIPIKEVEAIRSHEIVNRDIKVQHGIYKIETANGHSFEMQMEIELQKTTAERFEIILRNDGVRQLKIIFDLKQQMLYVDRNNADGWSEGCSRSPLIMKDKKLIKIHALIDKSSVELFTDDYHTSHSCNVFAGEMQVDNFVIPKNGSIYIKRISTWELCNTMK